MRDVVSVGAAAMIIATARSSLADHYFVPSGSMLPTVHTGDRVFVDKSAYDLRVPFTSVSLAERRDPARGDVVVLTSPESGDTLLKRLVAVPGDRVEVRDGALRLNGAAVPIEPSPTGPVEKLGREHHLDLDSGGGPDFGPRTLGDDEYLVMGDNRGNSHDGRSFGFVSRSALKGRAVGVYARDGAPTFLKL
jgi:signal peptidase I